MQFRGCSKIGLLAAPAIAGQVKDSTRNCDKAQEQQYMMGRELIEFEQWQNRCYVNRDVQYAEPVVQFTAN